MSEAKPTPGPWVRGSVLNRGEAVIAVNQPQHKRIIALIEWNRDSLTEGANARLIASAPDLLAALKGARNFIVNYVNHKADLSLLIGSIDTAISKAEGRIL